MKTRTAYYKNMNEYVLYRKGDGKLAIYETGEFKPLGNELAVFTNKQQALRAMITFIADDIRDHQVAIMNLRYQQTMAVRALDNILENA